MSAPCGEGLVVDDMKNCHTSTHQQLVSTLTSHSLGSRCEHTAQHSVSHASKLGILSSRAKSDSEIYRSTSQKNHGPQTMKQTTAAPDHKVTIPAKGTAAPAPELSLEKSPKLDPLLELF